MDSLTRLELFSFEDRSVVTKFDKDGNVAHTEVKAEKGVVSYGLSNGELRVDNPDGTGFTLMVNPLLINNLMEWISSNIKKANEKEAHYRQQLDEEHAERMKSLQAETERSLFRLEEEKLQHEIRMVELQTELAEKKLELKRAQEELEPQQ